MTAVFQVRSDRQRFFEHSKIAGLMHRNQMACLVTVLGGLWGFRALPTTTCGHRARCADLVWRSSQAYFPAGHPACTSPKVKVSKGPRHRAAGPVTMPMSGVGETWISRGRAAPAEMIASSASILKDNNCQVISYTNQNQLLGRMKSRVWRFSHVPATSYSREFAVFRLSE